MLDFGPCGIIFWASSRNILTHHPKKKMWHEKFSKIFSDVAWNMFQRFFLFPIEHCSLFVAHPPASLKFSIGIRLILLVKPTIASFDFPLKIKGTFEGF
jgi:hypothetical protein